MSKLPSSKVSKGVVTADPAKVLPVGSKLRFQPTPITGEVPEGAATLRNWEFFEGLLLQIALTDGEHDARFPPSLGQHPLAAQFGSLQAERSPSGFVMPAL